MTVCYTEKNSLKGAIFVNLPTHFICASSDYADFDHPVAAPYLRKTFSAPSSVQMCIRDRMISMPISRSILVSSMFASAGKKVISG